MPAAYPRNRPGLNSSGVTPDTGQGPSRISEAAADAIAGEVCRPAPPWPATQKNPSASGAKPTTGMRSGANVRKPAQRWTMRFTGMTEVARRLGIGRSTLYRKLGELGIDTAA